MFGSTTLGEIMARLREVTGRSDEELRAMFATAVSEARPPKADRFFTAAQQGRLKELFDRWRAARDTRSSLPAEDQAELERLTAVELEATGLRLKAAPEDLVRWTSNSPLPPLQDQQCEAPREAAGSS